MNKKIIQNYKERLFDISKRNSSIALTRIIQKRTFDLSTLPKKIQIEIFNNIIKGNKKTPIVPIISKKKLEASQSNSLSKLYRQLNFLENETGSYNLYIGYPFIEGNFDDGTYFRAPLILFPVNMYRGDGRTKKWMIEPSNQEEPFLNKTILFAINKFNKEENNIDININQNFDISEFKYSNYDELITEIINLFARYNIKLDDNDFELEITNIETIKKEDRPKDLKGQIKLRNHLILGQFSQSNEELENDFNNIIKDSIYNDTIKILLNDKELELEEQLSDETLNNTSETENNLIYIPDSSQEKVIISAKKSKGLVIHGPPGTGKSQVITNIIANEISQGKKILVVSEKRAALDVVKNRLAEKNIENQVLLIHDYLKDRNKTFEKIHEVLNKYDSTKSNKIKKYENEILNLSKEFDKTLEQMDKLSKSFSKILPFGKSLNYLYKHSNRYDENLFSIDKHITSRITYNMLNKELEQIKIISKHFKEFDENENNLIKYRKDFSNKKFDKFNYINNIKKLKQVLEEFEKTFYSENFETLKKKYKFKKTDLFYDLKKVSTYFERFEKNKDKKTKYINPLWIISKLKLNKLIKNKTTQDIKLLNEYFETIKNITIKVENTFEEIEDFFKDEFFEKLSTLYFEFNNEKPSTKIEELIKLYKRIDDIITYDKTKKSLDYLGKKILNECKNNIKDPEKWTKTYKNNFYLNLIESIEIIDQELKSFNSEEYKKLYETLKKIYKRKVELIPLYINELFHQKYEDLKYKNTDNKKTYNYFKQLIYETGKKRRRWSLRKLIYSFHNEHLFDIFPCILCSPETVSAIFPLIEDLFDTVIFDESSQVKIEKAIPSIIRGNKLIVAGDEKQLPPTSFFSSSMTIDDIDEEEYNDEELSMLEKESLLDFSIPVFNSKRLMNHYRSQRKELIDFSNKYFYSNTLKMVPKVILESKEPAIEFKKIKGLWENNTNKKEAEAIVKWVSKYLKENSKKKEYYNLGIITFNSKQKDLIEDLFEKECQKDEEFDKLYNYEIKRKKDDKLINLFVKNIENVQGDERDIILFSISYAKDKEGKLRYHFGPLNSNKGENRLNVAISRAREKIIVFSSITGEELKYNGKFNGPKVLKDYLIYSKAVSENDQKTIENLFKDKIDASLKENRFKDLDSQASLKEKISNKLKEKNIKFKNDVGSLGYFIDIAILPKNFEFDEKNTLKQKNAQNKTNTKILKDIKFKAGILVDDDEFYLEGYNKEKHFFRRLMLENSGWNIKQIWSRDWWINDETVIQKIIDETKKN